MNSPARRRAVLKVVNPFNQKTVCAFPWDGPAEIESKLESARKAQARWSRLDVPERIRRIESGLDYFRAHRDRIARDITVQMGKPITQSRREIDTFFERARYMMSIAVKSLAPDVMPARGGMSLRMEHVPLGVVLNIAAWNYPLLIPCNVVVPALLAGNTVLLKHSERTPLCGRHFERAFGRAGMPGLVTNLTTTHDATARVISDPRVGFVAFTGSVRGGRQVYRKSARRIVDVGLELGGKDPAYVAEDADMDFTVENVVDGACYNAGQSCCAVERVYVHRTRYDEFLQKAIPVLQRYRMGDPLEETTTMGPLARKSLPAELGRRVKAAVSMGAEILLGGARPRLAGNFFPPTLLANVPQASRVMREESFGPIVPVKAVSGDAEAVRLMNDSRYGLTASVWTRDRSRAEFFARALDAGTVYQNRCDYLHPALAWTGARDSGLGSTLSKYGFFHLTRRKNIHFRPAVWPKY